jgi:hypothetical protein
MQVVNTVELVGKYLPTLKKMPEIRPGIMAAGVAGALLIKRPVIIPITTVFYNNSAL